MSENHESGSQLFEAKFPHHPSKFYAFPVLGFIIKMILLIPVFIVMICYSLVWFVLWNLNSFCILFSGTYWTTAFDYNVSLMRYLIKIYLYLLGISNAYPGFSMSPLDSFEVNFKKPANPNRILAIPLVGLFIRLIVLIPYTIFQRVMQNGMYVCFFIAWYPILTEGKFPQSLFEFEHDAITVLMRKFSFLTGLTDSYPSFHISMKNKNIKIVLLILGAILFIISWTHTNLPAYQTQPMMFYQP